jgi:probable HAF family extracellular repeat protein
LLSCLFGSMILSGPVGTGQAQTASSIAPSQHEAAQPATYRVINLLPGNLTAMPAINSSGQVAFSLDNGRAWFYDGAATQDIGTLGGPTAYATGLNNVGQVAGFSSLAAGPLFHAYVWSKGSGMLDLGTLAGFGSSTATAINYRGQVAGTSTAPNSQLHAFRWSAVSGMEDVGTFADNLSGFTNATAINDAGFVAGWGDAANGDGHAFAWTRKTGLIDLGTLGGPISFAVAVDAAGQVAGYSSLAGGVVHAFLWNRSSGMKDLGAAGGAESFASAMSADGHVAGGIDFSNGGRHAFSWTPVSGMVDLGTLGGDASEALAVNNKGQIVGWTSTRHARSHAMVWSARHGMVDLNKRLRHAPAGLVLDNAVAISDNGSIVATSNAGLVLLKPDGRDCGCSGHHTAGPIEAADMVEVGAPFDTSVSFAGADAAAKHNVIWSWGDGSGDQAGNARANNGVGSASGSHAYTTPGIYTVTANVVDLAGRSVAVSRTIVAYDRSTGFAGGSGWFMSPHGANKKSRIPASKASFSFIAPSTNPEAKAISTKSQLRFNVAGLSLRSENIRPVVAQGVQGKFEGSGTINGAGDYKFTLDTTAGAVAGQGERSRFGLKIWHIDPATKAQVIDYDNTGLGAEGGAVVEGKITVQQ